MDELHSIRVDIVTCKNSNENPASVDVEVSEFQSKI